MNKIEFAIIASYLLMTCYFFINWLRFTLRYPSSSPEEKFFSLVMFVISTIFWPIIVPMSCIETFRTKKFEFSVVVPILVAVSAFSLVFYMAQQLLRIFCIATCLLTPLFVVQAQAKFYKIRVSGIRNISSFNCIYNCISIYKLIWYALF